MYSDRGKPLVCQDTCGRPYCKTPILTVENYIKWYCLYLIRPSGEVEAVDFPDDGYCDHVPYPAAVERMAAKNGWVVDEQSLEMMIGRYMLEVKQVPLEAFE